MPASKPGFCAGTRDLHKSVGHGTARIKAAAIVKGFVTRDRINDAGHLLLEASGVAIFAVVGKQWRLEQVVQVWVEAVQHL
ncbi:hypothetical protein GCM10007170_16260 [Arthrobacter liuii]|uniref:Uncharacterized protein n=1 Tax=Arthrobacter liuii TaxID=1476996 RepID=A0ABQ2AMY6_9MICC|nr:hypothetical protein GCM10007170_16260 [Arthrobacter liuii]